MLLGIVKVDKYTAKEDSEVVKVLLEARRLIKWGWCKKTMTKWRPFGLSKYCVSGAIREADNRVFTGGDYQNTVHLARLAFRKTIGTYIEQWNDAPERTKKEVLAAFDATIERERICV